MTHRDFLDGTPVLSKADRINYMWNVSGCWVQDHFKKSCPRNNISCMDCVFATIKKHSL